MKTMTTLTMGCAVAAGSLLVAGIAAAQPGPRQGPGAADRPGPPRDFSMTYEQAQERWPNLTQERFDELDTDGDGVLTRADRVGRGDRPGRPGVGNRPGRPGAGQGPGAGNRPGPARDFSMTYEQAQERWPNMTQERFDELDIDGDGVLTPADRMGRPGLRADRPRDGQGNGFRPRGERGEGDVNPRGEARPRDGQGVGLRPRGERGEGDVNPRGERRPRNGRGPVPAE